MPKVSQALSEVQQIYRTQAIYLVLYGYVTRAFEEDITVSESQVIDEFCERFKFSEDSKGTLRRQLTEIRLLLRNNKGRL